MAGSAGHPDRGPKARHALTFNPDHPMGAGQKRRKLLNRKSVVYNLKAYFSFPEVRWRTIYQRMLMN